jgi:uncharacterized protein (TIGR02145 family)
MKKIVFLAIALSSGFFSAGQNTITDKRDGNIYQTVTIDGTTWLAENLRFKTKEGSESWRGYTGRKTLTYAKIYEQDEAFDKTHGRYYSYEAALKACPTGWTLPDESDFAILSNKFGGDKKSGHSLKSKEGWPWGTSGDNTSGFNLKPYGSIYNGHNSGDNTIDGSIIEEVYLWVKGKIKDGKAPFRVLSSSNGNTEEAINFRPSVFPVKKIKMTIRCVKK